MAIERGPSSEDIKFIADDEEETKIDSNLLVGVTKDRAGNPDYSKAAVWKLSLGEQEDFERGREKIKQENAEARRKKLEIPAEILPGTSAMVKYKLRNAGILKTERLNELTGDSQKRLKAEIEQYRDGLEIVEELEDQAWEANGLSKWEEKNGKFKGLDSEEEVNKAMAVPAAEMIDMVDILVQNWEELAEKNPELDTVYIGSGSGRKIDYTEFLAAARNLKLRLAAEDIESQKSSTK